MEIKNTSSLDISTEESEFKDIVPDMKPTNQFLPSQLIEKAVQGGTATVEVIERLVGLQERHEEKMAKREFEQSMAKLQQEMPTIKKLKDNGGTKSKYAPIEDIVEQTKKFISNAGFTYRWNTKEENGKILVECIATHSGGHSEVSMMSSEISAGTSANNAPQKAAITVTYLKRYTFSNMFGIMVAGEDMDARMDKVQKSKIPKASAEEITKGKIVSALNHIKGVKVAKSAMEEEIKSLTGLDAKVKENLDEILMRLEAIISEQNETA